MHLPPTPSRSPRIRSPRRSGRSGPGLILAASIVGTGELINTTSLGAKAGFSLLWLILFSCVIKVFVQVELGRYAITHGKTTLAAFDSLPGPRAGVSWLCWLWLLMMLTTQAQIAAMEGAVGQAAHMAFPGASSTIAAGVRASWAHHGSLIFCRTRSISGRPLTTLAAVLLLLSGGYRRLEKITTVLVAAVTLFTVASVLILQWTRFRITPADIGHGFELAVPPAAVVLAFSAFGITGVGASELFAYPYWCIEKGYARYTGARSEDEAWARRARGWTRVMQLDAWFSMVVFTVATVAFYFLAPPCCIRRASTPRARRCCRPCRGSICSRSRERRCRGSPRSRAWAFCWEPGPSCSRRSTSPRPPTAGSPPTSFTSSASGRSGGPAVRERLVKIFCVLYPALSLGLYYAFREPKGLIMAGGTAQALMLPFIAGATLYLRQRDTDRRVGPSFLSDILTWIAFFSISAVAIYSTYGQLPALLSQPQDVTARSQIMAHSLIRLLLKARYVTFSTVVVLLVLLAWTGKRVTYDQSITSFFADDDPDMAVYQKAAATFGDDNFVFVVYDDPALLTPAGMDRVRELAAALGPDHVPARAARRIDRCDAAALGDRRRPARARSASRLRPQFRQERRQAHGQEHRPEIQLDDGRRRGAGRHERPTSSGCAQGSPDSSSAFPGNADRYDAARPRPWSCA